jgi:TPR repeat protein/AcrR family transcriptional regulator
LPGTMSAMRARTTSVWTIPRERREMRGKLLDIARELIASYGEDKLTLSAVANQADIAHATIYGYFSSKREMLAALSSEPATPWEPELITLEPALVAADPAPEASDAVAAVAAEEAPAHMPVVPEEVEDTVPWDDDAADHADETAEFHPQPIEAVAPTVQPEETSSISESAVEAAPIEAQAPLDAETNITSEEPVETEPAPAADVEALAIAEASVEAEAPALEEEAAGTVHEPVADDDVSYFEAANDASADPVEVSVLDETVPEESIPPLESMLPSDARRRAQAAQLDTIARHLVLPPSGSTEGTDSMISRLEHRLRVLESSITSLDAKHNSLDARASRQARPVTDQMEQILKRSEDFEAKHLKTLSELRLEIHELGTRLNSTDSAPKGAVSEALSWSRFVQEPVAIKPAANAESDADSKGADATAATDEPKHAYLSAVRTLAKEGAKQAAERENIEEAEQRVRRRKVYIAAGVAVMCVGALGLLFEFHPGSHGVSVAQAKIAPAHTSVRTATMAGATHAPLDRLTALANKGDARAELVVGLKYLSGDGVTADDAQAARWLERAAQHGNAVAQNHLGALYQNGRGVARDTAEAKRWYEMAAAQGDRHAMSNLAVLYAGATGADKDFASAATWFQRSASLGYVDAQFNLAVLFERGDGVPQSLLDAYRWYSIAAASGDAVAKTRAEAIATQISPEELQAAQRAVALFKPQPLSPAANDVPTMQQVLASR